MSYFLGIDYGTKSTGFAIGQDLIQTAQPLTTLRFSNGKLDITQLDAIFKEWQVAVVVMGYPLNQDGTPTRVAPRVRKFANWLVKTYKVPVALVDERNSTTTAREFIFTQKSSRSLQKNVVDKVSAAVILQSYLDGEVPLETIYPKES